MFQRLGLRPGHRRVGHLRRHVDVRDVQGPDAFNQDIGGWNVDKVATMKAIFNDATAFDQDLGWCVGTAT